MGLSLVMQDVVRVFAFGFFVGAPHAEPVQQALLPEAPQPGMTSPPLTPASRAP